MPIDWREGPGGVAHLAEAQVHARKAQEAFEKRAALSRAANDRPKQDFYEALTLAAANVVADLEHLIVLIVGEEER